MKIECDELLVICDNCGHAIRVKELDNNLIKLNNKNDKLISEQDAIDALIEWYGCEPNGMDYFKEILAKKSSVQPVDKDINVPINDTISRQAAIDEVLAWLKDSMSDKKNGKPLTERLKDLPSAQPERIKGHWVEIASSNHTYKCSVCGRLLVNITDGKNNVAKNYPYCHCGADMRGEQDD